MKPVIELIRKTDDHNPLEPVELFACGKCGRLCSPRIYFAGAENALVAAREMAEKCCEPVKCDCGKLCEQKYRTSCNDCLGRVARTKFQEKLDRATKHTIQTAPDGPWMEDDGEEIVYSLDSLIENLAHKDIDRDSFPIYAWLCDVEKPQYDLDNFGERFHEELELHEDAELDSICTDLQELKDFVTKWNEKQEAKLWKPAFDHYVEINYEDVYPPEPVSDGEKGET